MKRQVGTVHFVVEGEFITDFFRQRVLEGAWDRALKGLVDSFNELTYDHAISILKGEKKLVGENSCQLVDEDRDLSEYLGTLAWQTAGVFRDGDQYYEPYSYIEGFGPGDMVGIMGRNPAKSADRATHYMDDPIKDRVIQMPVTVMESPGLILCRQTKVPPFWMEVGSDPVAALTECLKIKHFSRRGFAGVEERRERLREEREVEEKEDDDIEERPRFFDDKTNRLLDPVVEGQPPMRTEPYLIGDLTATVDPDKELPYSPYGYLISADGTIYPLQDQWIHGAVLATLFPEKAKEEGFEVPIPADAHLPGYQAFELEFGVELQAIRTCSLRMASPPSIDLGKQPNTKEQFESLVKVAKAMRLTAFDQVYTDHGDLTLKEVLQMCRGDN